MENSSMDDSIFADRVMDVPPSFIREILKVALNHEIISFAGGLPNRQLFPVEEIKAATQKVLDNQGRDVLQYSNSEGYIELRKLIAERYLAKKNLNIPVENILITNGSQQGLDLLGKTLLNDGDALIIEEPGYLGAIQAFSIYKPSFKAVTVNDEGMDVHKLKTAMSACKPKLLYSVPNFQNPAGISYSEENRKAVAEVLKGTKTFLIEDDPYGDLRYSGKPINSFKSYLPDNTIMLGSFSKIVAPGLRLGWIVAPDALMDKLIIAKQASDLNSSFFTQCIVCQYWKDNDIEKHIGRIREVYGRQAKAMLDSIDEFFPKQVTHTTPEGGMFLWASLPANISSRDLLKLAIKDKVVFVPGDTFYVKNDKLNSMRLNFSCVDEGTIRDGIERLSKAIKKLLS
jgi:2-aminoadipate transaminase